MEKFADILLDEIKRTLRRGERVELEDGVFSANTQKPGYQGTLKQVKK